MVCPTRRRSGWSKGIYFQFENEALSADFRLAVENSVQRESPPNRKLLPKREIHRPPEIGDPASNVFPGEVSVDQNRFDGVQSGFDLSGRLIGVKRCPLFTHTGCSGNKKETPPRSL